MGLDEDTALACERSVSIAFRIEPFRSIGRAISRHFALSTYAS